MAEPTNIILHQQSKILEISFDDGNDFNLPYEYLRVYSPSAEVMGHGGFPPETLERDKGDVSIKEIEPVGRYAIRINFDDGHDTGLYTWDWFYTLGQNYDEYWQLYLKRIAEEDQNT